MNDTDTLTNLINLAFNLRILLIDDWIQLGHDPKQPKRRWSQHQGSSDLFPLTTYDWNSHIPSHGKTCNPAVRNNIWDLESTKKGGCMKLRPHPMFEPEKCNREISSRGSDPCDCLIFLLWCMFAAILRKVTALLIWIFQQSLCGFPFSAWTVATTHFTSSHQQQLLNCLQFFSGQSPKSPKWQQAA